MMNLATLVNSLRCSLLSIERRLLQAAGLERQLGEFLEPSRQKVILLLTIDTCPVS